MKMSIHFNMNYWAYGATLPAKFDVFADFFASTKVTSHEICQLFRRADIDILGALQTFTVTFKDLFTVVFKHFSIGAKTHGRDCGLLFQKPRDCIGRESVNDIGHIGFALVKEFFAKRFWAVHTDMWMRFVYTNIRAVQKEFASKACPATNIHDIGRDFLRIHVGADYFIVLWQKHIPTVV